MHTGLARVHLVLRNARRRRRAMRARATPSSSVRRPVADACAGRAASDLRCALLVKRPSGGL